MKQISESDRATLVNALNVAAEQYERDSRDTRRSARPAGASNAGIESLARQFQTQADRARQLAELVETAGAVTIA